MGYVIFEQGSDLVISNQNTNGNILLETEGTGKIGIGTSTPQSLVHVSTGSSDEFRGIISEQLSDNAGAPQIRLRKSRETSGTPTAVISGDYLGILIFDGYTGSDYNDGCYIRGITSENWSPTANGSNLAFYTVTNGTITPQERVRINNQGAVGIGTSSPESVLHIATNVDSALRSFILQHACNLINDPFISLRKSRGTLSSLSPVLSGDRLGTLTFDGYHENGFSVGGFIRAQSTENWSTSSHGTEIRIGTTNNGSSTQEERLIINNQGYVGIGTSSPASLLHVGAGSSPLWPTISPMFVSNNGDTILEIKDSTNNIRFVMGCYSGLTLFGSRSNHDVYMQANGSNNMVLKPSGNVGFSITSPTATIHIKGGSQTGGTAPIKFTAGTDMINPESGALEWDGTNLKITNTSGERKTLAYSGGAGDYAPTMHASNSSTYGYGDTTNAGHLRVGTGLSVSSGTTSVNFGGSGSANTVSRSDHTHSSLTGNYSGTIYADKIYQNAGTQKLEYDRYTITISNGVVSNVSLSNNNSTNVSWPF